MYDDEQMDRTSILGDAIDYMKELLERIKKLQDQDMEVRTSPLTLMGFPREQKPNEVLVRNSPKVYVMYVYKHENYFLSKVSWTLFGHFW